MRAEIKNLFSLNIDDLEHFVPEDPGLFRVPIRLVAGPEGTEGEESFDFEVCSPRALAQEVGDEGMLLLRHRLLMTSFDFARVRRFVDRHVRGCEGAEWDEVANKLARLGQWEFEDYREWKVASGHNLLLLRHLAAGHGHGHRFLGHEGAQPHQVSERSCWAKCAGCRRCTSNGAWKVSGSGTTRDLRGVWGSSKSDVWLVGGLGTVIRFGGSIAAAQVSGSTEPINAVWGSEPGSVWFGDDGAQILRSQP